jgi:large subunit ribosomal protein L9
VEVILKKDVKAQGKRGDLINASDGYARNFLIPKGLAVEATPGAKKEFEIQKQAADKRHKIEEDAARETAKKLETIIIKIGAKSGENGKLFGSITAQNVSDALSEQFGIDIDKRIFDVGGGIKNLGITEIMVKIYANITTKLKVSVVEEK